MSDPAFAVVGDRIVPFGDAFLSPLSSVVQYGLGCFEGIRGHRRDDGDIVLFRLDDHLRRLKESAALLRIELPAPPDRLAELIVELVARERIESDVYVRPLAYKAGVRLGGMLDDMTDGFVALAVPIDGDPAAPEPALVCTSSWRRVADTMIPPRAKVTGAYVNSLIARSDARRLGFADALLLSADGYVAEASGSNVFLVRNGELLTPPVSEDILEGITRDTVLALAAELLDLRIVERRIRRSELYTADEVFLCGTGINIRPVTAVDQMPIGDGNVGAHTAALLAAYAHALQGDLPGHDAWWTFVAPPSRSPAA